MLRAWFDGKWNPSKVTTRYEGTQTNEGAGAGYPSSNLRSINKTNVTY